MTRLVARLVLAMLLLPIAGAVMLLGLAAIMGPAGPAILRLALLWGAVYALVAVYWIMLWRDVVRWTRRRVVLTVAASALALLAGAAATGILAQLGAGMPMNAAVLIGGGVVPIVWVLATVLIWRETPHERVERLVDLGAGVWCPICGYNLTGLLAARCPECGAQFTLDQLFTAQPRAEKQSTAR